MPAASASASGFPPGSDAATASADEGRSRGSCFDAAFDRPHDRAVDVPRHARNARRPVRRLPSLGEWRPAGEHLVEHQPERVEIAAHRDLAPRQLLGRHVGGRAAAHGARSRSRAVDASPKSVMRTCPRPSTITLAGLRSRCSTPLSCAAASPAQSWRAISSALSCRQPADAPQQRRQVLAVDVLHREEGGALELADVVDAADVRMRDLARQRALRRATAPAARGSRAAPRAGTSAPPAAPA